MISMELAAKIWRCHQEIETATLLHKEALDMIAKAEPPHWKDAFGRQQGLQLGIPSGDNSRRLFDVSPSASVAVLVDHIASKGKELRQLNKEAQDLLRGADL